MARKPVKVSQLNSYIRRILQSDPVLLNASVIGEISNIKYHSSGHVFFSLKDEKSTVNCFLPADNVYKIRYELTDGMEITVHGYVSVYEKGGRYSLTVRDVDVSGKGDLAAAFEKLKTKLSEKGVFDPSRKKKLPVFPEKIAIVTSPTGAALQDMLKIITSKNKITDILIFPVLVQGDGAANDISEAIDYINLKLEDVDVIITGRGGGSTEDLWAFNEEPVAMSIFNSNIPVISAVGHETDFTIADFAADVRAETPTAAAHMAVPDIEKLKEYVDSLSGNNVNALLRISDTRKNKLERYNIAESGRILVQKISMKRMIVQNMYDETVSDIKLKLDRYRNRISILNESVNGSNPKRIIDKGYAAVLDESGVFIKRSGSLKKNDDITLVFFDGEADCSVLEVRRDTLG